MSDKKREGMSSVDVAWLRMDRPSNLMVICGVLAMHLRIHHCYADGIALIQVLLSMTDADRAGRRAGPVPTSAANRGDAEDDALAQLLAPLAGLLKVASTAGSTLIERGTELWRDPGKAVALAEQGGALIGEIAKLAL